jgi:hypothetical protein
MENARQLAPHHIQYLRGLPEMRVLEIDGEPYGLTHAYDEDGYSTPRSVEAFARFSRERFSRALRRIIFGHTHRREWVKLADDTFFLIPGSVSYRRDGETFQGAHYAVIQDGQVLLRSAPYPVEALYRRVQQSAVCDSEKAPAYRWWTPNYPENHPRHEVASSPGSAEGKRT